MTDVTVHEVLRKAASTLREAGVPTPEHDAALLLAEASGATLGDIRKAELLGESLTYVVSTAESHTAKADLQSSGMLALAASEIEDVSVQKERLLRLSVQALDKFSSMITRRATREPLQYIVGHAPFRYLDLQVGPGVFIPRQETETVVQAGLDWLESQQIVHPRVVDLCAGSGAIGLAVLIEVPGSEVWAVEYSQQALLWTERNHKKVEIDYPQCIGAYHLVYGDATDPETLQELDDTVDLVISNPPYVPEFEVPEQLEVRDFDPDMALYGGSADGLVMPQRVIARAASLLRDGGLLVMEHDISQGAALVANAIEYGFEEARTELDWTGRPRFLVAQRSRRYLSMDCIGAHKYTEV